MDTDKIKYVVQRKERDTTSNPATNVTIHAGYDIYTRDSEIGVQRFSFDINGQLQGAASSLAGNELRQVEAVARLDLSGDGNVSTKVEERLFRGVAATAVDGGARSLYQSENGLFISTSIDLTTDNDLSNMTGGNNSYTDELPVLFLTNQDGNAFTIESSQTAIHTQRLTALNNDGSIRTEGYKLYLADGDENISNLEDEDIYVYTVEFNADGKAISEQQKLSDEEIEQAILVDRINLKAAYPSIADDDFRIKINAKLNIDGNRTTETSRSLYASCAGLLVGSNAIPNGYLDSDGNTGRLSATDPGIVRLRDINGDFIQSTNGETTGYQIDGMDVASADAITRRTGNISVTTGYEVVLKGYGQAARIKFDTNGYRVSVDAASIDHTLDIQVDAVNDAPIATFDASQSATEDGAVINGRLTSSDVDADDTASYSLKSAVLKDSTGNTINDETTEIPLLFKVYHQRQRLLVL